MANGHGGKREGSGRKSRSEEQELIEKLTPLEPIALEKLKEGLEEGNFRFVQLYMAYMYGKPKESKDITTNGESLNLGSIDWFSSDSETK